MGKKIIFLIIAMLLSINMIFGEVLLLKDGSVIKGKIIKMDEDNLVVLSEYGEMIIDRTKINNTFFDESEYYESIKKKNREESTPAKVETPKETIVEKVIERIVEVPSVKTFGIEFLLFYGMKPGMSFEDVNDILKQENIPYEQSKSKGIITVYLKKQLIDGLTRKNDAYIQLKFQEKILTDLYYSIIGAEDTKEITKNLGNLTGLEFETGGKGSIAKNNETLQTDVYFNETTIYSKSAVSIQLHEAGETGEEPDYPKVGIEFMAGFGFKHGLQVGIPFIIATHDIGLSVPFDILAVWRTGSFGLKYVFSPSVSLMFSFGPGVDLNHKVMLSVKNNGLFMNKGFVFNIGVNFGYYNTIFNVNSQFYGDVWYYGPSIYLGGETRNKSKRSFAYGAGWFIDGKFGRARYERSNNNNGSRYYETINGPFATVSTGVQLMWHGVARKTIY